jgi:hypothetical protein
MPASAITRQTVSSSVYVAGMTCSIPPGGRGQGHPAGHPALITDHHADFQVEVASEAPPLTAKIDGSACSSALPGSGWRS